MDIVRVGAAGRKFSPLPYGTGVSLSPLLPNQRGGGSALLRFAPKSKFPRHDHPGGEEVYVLEGSLRVGDQMLRAGDYLWTPPGGIHDAESEEGCLLFLSAQEGIKVLE
ncbi:MAG TPA: cupin domain-containing protein [Candidatus Acidoferrum sp.]|nr:cupin domain-containing protein [Candidatus Acidoferrum sp.]